LDAGIEYRGDMAPGYGRNRDSGAAEYPVAPESQFRGGIPIPGRNPDSGAGFQFWGGYGAGIGIPAPRNIP